MCQQTQSRDSSQAAQLSEVIQAIDDLYIQRNNMIDFIIILRLQQTRYYLRLNKVLMKMNHTAQRDLYN
jgi:hypothetical protein